MSSFDEPGELEQELLNSVDECIKKVVTELDPENLIIHSDHGFGDPAWEENHHERYGFFLVNSPLTYIGQEEEAHIKDIYPYNPLDPGYIAP